MQQYVVLGLNTGLITPWSVNKTSKPQAPGSKGSSGVLVPYLDWSTRPGVANRFFHFMTGIRNETDDAIPSSYSISITALRCLILIIFGVFSDYLKFFVETDNSGQMYLIKCYVTQRSVHSLNTACLLASTLGCIHRFSTSHSVHKPVFKNEERPFVT